MGLAALAAGLTVVGCTSSPAADPAARRLAGDDRYATAAAISRDSFAGEAAVAFVTTGADFPDALAAAPAATRHKGPVLLVQRDAIPPAAADELRRLRPGRIVVLGGPAAVSDGVAQELRAYTSGSVDRISDSDRYGTAARLSAATFTSAPSVAFVATGQAFPDALTAGAAAASADGPVLLVEANAVPVATANELRRLQPESILVVGGTSAVTPSVEAQLRSFTSGPVSRAGGADRFATAVAVSRGSVQSPVHTVFVATGLAFPDALAAGGAAGMARGPVLLVPGVCVPDEVNAEIDRLRPSDIVVVGGPQAVSAEAASRAPCPLPSPCGFRAAPPAAYDHVIWIWMENHTFGQVIGSPSAPYETALARRCGTATRYSAVGRPSLPNYIGATSGGTQGIADDSPPSAHPLTVDNLFRQVRAAGKQERSYQESMPGNCALSSSGRYAVKHNPAAYYQGDADRAACASDDVPMGDTNGGPFADALRNDALPAFSFVTPNLCNDTHDCSVRTGDDWLAQWLPRIFSSPSYRSGTTAVFVVWDEPTPMPLVVISPSTVAGTVSNTPFDHFALLRTTEEALGIPSRLGRASTATSMRAAFRL